MSGCGTTSPPSGASASSGGYFRQPFGSAERECHAWFLDECARRDLPVTSDGNGNTIAWWLPSDASPGYSLTFGSRAGFGRNVRDYPEFGTEW